jgi:hypothetical protein
MPHRLPTKKSRGKGRVTRAKGTAKKAAKVGVSSLKTASDHLPIDQVRSQLLSYAGELQEYLGKVDANVENFKFGVEKTDSGLTIDGAFKATISS